MISGIVSACFFVQFMLCTIAPISWWYPIFNQTMSQILKTVICKASIILRALPALSFSMPFLPTPHTLVHLFFHSTNEHYSWVCFRPGTILGPMNIAGNKKQKKLTSQSSSERGYRPKKKNVVRTQHSPSTSWTLTPPRLHMSFPHFCVPCPAEMPTNSKGTA